MIPVTPKLSLDEKEIQYNFVRASGPGGQNVNKVATAVQLRFDVMRSSSLPEDIRHRLVKLAGKRMTSDGILVLDARQFRTQEQNRQDALGRLVEMVRRAAEKPRPRKKTRPSLASKQRRIDAKRHRSRTKSLRGDSVPID